jgi:hypothetical protein
MTTFDERERAFENKFAHDAEMQFRAQARRDKLLGLWAAELLGKEGPEADRYAADVLRADFQRPGDEDVLRKVAKDLGSRADEAAIRREMEALLTKAKAQVMAETD